MKRKINYFYLTFAVIAFLFMLFYGGVQSFWYDEVYQIGLCDTSVSLKGLLKSYAMLEDYTPPLYAVLMHFWYMLVPYGNEWLLIPSELFAAVGIYMMGLLGESAGSKKTGIFASLVGACSEVIFINAAFEFRSYALVFCAMTFTLWFYGKKNREGTIKNIIIYGLALMVLVYSHYYGAVVCGALVFFDLFLLWKKKIGFKHSISYFMAGISFFPWLLLVAVYHERSIAEFWIQPAKWTDIKAVYDFLLSDNRIFAVMFLAGILLVIMMMIKGEWQTFYEKRLSVLNVWILFFVTFTMFLYGAFLNKQGSIFLARYFLTVLPCTLVLVAEGFSAFAEAWNGKKGYYGIVISAAVILYAGFDTYVKIEAAVQTSSYPYEETAEKLLEQADIYDQNVLILSKDNRKVTQGWKYYLTKKESLPEVRIVAQELASYEECLNYDKIYLVGFKQPITEATAAFLKDNYKKIGEMKECKVTIYSKQ